MEVHNVVHLAGSQAESPVTHYWMFPITYQVDLCEGHDCQCLPKLMTIHCKCHKRVHVFMMIDASPLSDLVHCTILWLD